MDIVISNHKVTGYVTDSHKINGMEKEVHEKNAKSSKVRKQANVERKDDLCEEKLAVMNSKYVYPNIFMSIDDTNKVSQYDTDIKKYAEQKKADWILNGGIEKEWDSYLKKMEQ